MLSNLNITTIYCYTRFCYFPSNLSFFPYDVLYCTSRYTKDILAHAYNWLIQFSPIILHMRYTLWSLSDARHMTHFSHIRPFLSFPSNARAERIAADVALIATSRETLLRHKSTVYTTTLQCTAYSSNYNWLLSCIKVHIYVTTADRGKQSSLECAPENPCKPQGLYLCNIRKEERKKYSTAWCKTDRLDFQVPWLADADWRRYRLAKTRKVLAPQLAVTST